MAASESHPRSDTNSTEASECLSAPALLARLEEEISRAERHGTELSCLLMSIDDVDEMTPEQSAELRGQTLAYVSAALGRELRSFDRIGHASERELLIVLPGADSPRGEIVARRVLDRLRAIKVEASGTRRPLSVSVGLAAWRREGGAVELLRRARSAARLGDGGEHEGGPETIDALQRARFEPPAARGLR